MTIPQQENGDGKFCGWRLILFLSGMTFILAFIVFLVFLQFLHVFFTW